MMLRRSAVVAYGLAALAAPLIAQDSAQRGVRIGLGYSASGPRSIAVLPVRAGDQRAADSLRAMLQRDFHNGDRITIAGWDANDLPPVSGTPNFDLFPRIDGIVQATLMDEGGLHIALYDVRGKTLANAQTFPVGDETYSPKWRLAVHRAADEVERWATGVRGISATRIAFSREGKLWTVDSDGANATPLAGTEAGMFPSWHPSGRYIAFTQLSELGAQIALKDLHLGATRRLTSTRDATNSTPVFSPNGTTLAYSFGDDGADIYTMDPFTGGGRQRITVLESGRNTSPTFSPDGRRIAFTSGRLGHAQVYWSDVDGSNADLLTSYGFGDQNYRSNPAWSPDNRYVAFQSQLEGLFQVMLISTRDRTTRQLTSESENEDPSWAPDGRHIVFTSKRSGVQQLWVLDIESGRSRPLTEGRAARHPAWSPALLGGV